MLVLYTSSTCLEKKLKDLTQRVSKRLTSQTRAQMDLPSNLVDDEILYYLNWRQRITSSKFHRILLGRQASRIQAWFRRFRYRYPLIIEDWMYKNKIDIEKAHRTRFFTKLTRRLYLVHYDLEYLRSYPEFVAKKTANPQLESWIKSKLPNDHNCRTIRMMRQFFIDCEITSSTFAYVGW